MTTTRKSNKHRNDRKLSHGWFDVIDYPDGVTRIAESGHRYRQNSYIVSGNDQTAVIDAGMGFAEFYELVRSLTDTEPILLLTHAHWDHIGDAARFQQIKVHPLEADTLRRGAPNESLRHWFHDRHFYGVELPETTDPETRSIAGVEPTGFLNDGDVIDLGGRQLEVIHTPGHSVGSVSFLDRNARALFTGDTYYRGAILCNFSGTSATGYRESFRTFAELVDEVDAVYPAHYASPLPAGDLLQVHQAYEEIWAGKKPDIHRHDTDIFRFPEFSFWMRTGSYGQSSSDVE